MARPDTNQLLAEVWGWGDEYSTYWAYFALASNILTGTNPPYSATDFFDWFPQFGGIPAQPLGTLDGTTAEVTAVSDMTGVAVGQPVEGIGIADGSVIINLNVTNKTITLNQITLEAGEVTLTIYTKPAVPIPVLNNYIYLATNSILQRRYCEMWPKAMALYIAHYLTLWLQGQAAGPGSTPAQLAGAGMAAGLRVAKAVGDVSTASKPLDGFADWGTYQLTLYGQELVTFAMAVGSGGVLAW